jgi:hypothetical protein
VAWRDGSQRHDFPVTAADLGELLGGAALGDTLARLRTAAQPTRVVAGWATVELDRAVLEVPAQLRATRGLSSTEPAPDDRVLGARCRLLQFPAGGDVLLFEPSTEGRLAAALARHGEGIVALYLVADSGAAERARQAGLRLGAEGKGPFGAERLVLAGPRDGPFLLLVED